VLGGRAPASRAAQPAGQAAHRVQGAEGVSRFWPSGISP
jgi:hypothetical protein